MRSSRVSSGDRLRVAAIALLLFEGGIHLQQYRGILHFVPTINTLFLLNAVSAALIALTLAASRNEVAILAALSGIGMTVVALVSLAIARAGVLFGYSEPTLRAAVVLATVVELTTIVVASAFVVARVREMAARRPR